MRCRTVTILGVLAVLFGTVAGLPGVARAGDAEQLVDQYLQDQGAQGYVIVPVTENYVGVTFRNIAFFGVFFQQYPVTVQPPEGLAQSNVFYVQDGKVGYLTQPGDLEEFFFTQLRPRRTDTAIWDAGRTWLCLSENFSQDLFYQFHKPRVRVQGGVATGVVAVEAGGHGQITVSLTFDDAGHLVDIQETRDVVQGARPI